LESLQNDIEVWGMSPLSKRILRLSNFNHIKKRRQENFNFLLSELLNDSRFHVPLKSINEGICPLLFPVYIKNRDFIYKFLKLGLVTHDWWGDFTPMFHGWNFGMQFI